MKTGQVWAVTMARDEADIIAHTLQQLLYQGVDGIIVADNLSTDGTRDVLEAVRGNIRIVDDKEVGYYQGRKMTALAAQAAGLGAEWIIPFDADELWYAAGTETIAEVLRRQPEAVQHAKVDRWNHYCTPGDDSGNPNPYERILYRSRRPASIGKCLLRYSADYQIRTGNHGLTNKGRSMPCGPALEVRIRHFPCRSFDHFLRKVRNGAEAMKAATLPHGILGVWKRNAAILDKQGEAGLRREFESRYIKETSVLKYSPAPYLTDASGEQLQMEEAS